MAGEVPKVAAAAGSNGAGREQRVLIVPFRIGMATAGNDPARPVPELS